MAWVVVVVDEAIKLGHVMFYHQNWVKIEHVIKHKGKPHSVLLFGWWSSHSWATGPLQLLFGWWSSCTTINYREEVVAGPTWMLSALATRHGVYYICRVQ